MNDAQTVRVHPFVMGRETLGRTAGAVIRAKLVGHIDSQAGAGPVRISLQGVKKVDVGFVAEAIIALLAHYRGIKPMFLADVADPDLLENIMAAAERAHEPVTISDGQNVQVIGLAPTRGTRDALAFALSRPEIRATEFAKEAGLTAQNASNKFKQLWEQGFLLRDLGKAASGGEEYTYRRIG